MNPLLLVAGVFLFVSGIVLGRQSQTPVSDLRSAVISETLAPTTDVVLTPTPSPTITNTITPTAKVTLTVSPSKTPSNTNQFIYPNATVITNSAGTTELRSSDDPSTITTWYENRFTSLGLSSRATAKTNTNGNVLIKLGASKEGLSIHVEIKKTPDSSETQIRVTQEANSNSDVKIRIENNEPYL